MTRKKVIKEYVIPALKHTWNENINKEVLEALGVDCISRQNVLDKIQRLIDAEQNNIDENGDYMNYARERVNAYEAIQFFVENDCLCPSVTSQVSKTGHWIDDKCSVCGKGTEDLISSCEWYRNEKPNFCPFCGLKIVDSKESVE